MRFETKMQEEHRLRQAEGRGLITQGEAILQEEYNPELDPDLHLRRWLKAIAVGLIAVPALIWAIGEGSNLAQQYLGQENAITSCANVCMPIIAGGTVLYIIVMGNLASK